MAPNTASPSSSRADLTPPSTKGKGADPIREPDEVSMPDAPEVEPFKLKEAVRVSQPDKFHGDRKNLNAFILQMEIYFSFNDDKFEEDYNSKSLFATSFLRGAALEWIEPFIHDFYEHESTDGSMVTTKTIYKTWDGFKKEIKRMFGDFNATQIAVRKLLDLRQTGSAINYATEFQRYGTKTGWDTTALIEIFQRGLKNHLREEIARVGATFTDVPTMIENIVQLDNRLYEFRKGQGRREGQGGRRPDGGNRGYQNQERSKQVNATQSRNPLSVEERTRRREKQLCYSCGQPGHQAAACSQGKPNKP